ncbi:hypothetical protein ACI780_23555 [Geodermatophilus sp. SYSU D00814]
MLTDRELDARLAGAAGVRDADLPALPEEFLGLVTADAGLSLVSADAGPASVVAARQLVADAREARAAAPPRRWSGRGMAVRVATAVVAIAAAWGTAVVVAGPASPDPQRSAPSVAAPVPGGLTLVAAEAVTFPVSLDPVPEDLVPVYSRRGGLPGYGDGPPWFVADLASAEGDRVLLGVYPEDPRSSEEYGSSHEGDPTGTATVDGAVASVWREDGVVTVLWERGDGQWIQLSGEGSYADTGALVAVGESIVDRPQPVGLQVGLAPAGWSVGGFEESRSLDLVSDVDPDLVLRLSAVGDQYAGTIDGLLDGLSLAAPVETVAVQGRPGRLALVEGDAGAPPSWMLVGRLADGRCFQLLAPEALTREQVLQIGEQVTAAA